MEREHFGRTAAVTPTPMRIPFLQPKDKDPAVHALGTQADEPDSVREARTRARQRLTGALVLLVLGVLLFPLLFETQPRPLSADTPIVTAARDPGIGSTVPAPLPVRAAPARPVAVVPADAASAAAVPPIARASDAAPAAKLPPAPPAPAAPVERPIVNNTSPAPAPPASAAVPGAEGSAARFVVQAGAFGEATALREARQKLEKIGLKTYTQVIDSGGGKRTRVRVGPFATRQEADAVAAKAKAAGFQANVLVL